MDAFAVSAASWPPPSEDGVRLENAGSVELLGETACAKNAEISAQHVRLFNNGECSAFACMHVRTERKPEHAQASLY